MGSSDNISIDHVMDEISELTASTLKKLVQEWSSMYNLTESMMDHAMEKFVEHIKDLYNDLIITENEKKEQYITELHNVLKECNDMQSLLKIQETCFIDESLPVTVNIENLKNYIVKYVDLKQERWSRWDYLKEKELELCNVLGMEAMELMSSIPSEEEIEILDLKIFTMNEDKLKRMDDYTQYRNTVMKAIDVLEITNLNSYEKMLLDSDSDNYFLTNENLENLKKLRNDYNKKVKSAETKIEQLKCELMKLWERLGVLEDEKEEFLNLNPGIGPSTVKKFSDEIAHCEALKREMLIPLTEKVLLEIGDYCDKLTYTDEQKNNILKPRGEDYSEELLDAYDQTLQTLRKEYNECRDIFEQYSKRQSFWEKMLYMENLAKDKNRLFNNRGGQLLKEEKERKMIEQKLPKIHQELVNKLHNYVKKTGKTFLFHGNDLLALINEEWENRLIEKEKKPSKKCESSSGSKRKAGCLGSSPSSSSKRIKASSRDHPDSICSTASSTKSSKKLRSKLLASENDSKIFTPTHFKYEPLNSLSSYSFFQDGLEERKRTVNTPKSVGRRALVELNSPVALHSSPADEDDRRGTFTVKKLMTPGSKMNRGKTPIAKRTRKSTRLLDKVPSEKNFAITPSRIPRGNMDSKTPNMRAATPVLTPKARKCALALPNTPRMRLNI